MVVVNPYLKKKKPSSAGAAPPASAPRPGSVVTPSKHGVAGAARSSVQHHKQQPSNQKATSKEAPMVTPGKGIAVNAKPVPPRPKPSSIPASAQKRPPTAATNYVDRKPSTMSSTAGRMPLKKGPGSLKQKLKQEIAMLKKKKQLKKLQKEAEERRRKMTAEKEEKDQERQILFAKMEEERKQKQTEQQKIQAMRLQEQQRKQQESQRHEEDLWQREKNQAEFKYQQELQVWRYKHQQWLQQQQQQQQQLALQQFQGYPLYQAPSMGMYPGYPVQPHGFQQGFNITPSFARMPTNLLPPPPPPPRPPMLVRNPQRAVVAHASRQKASSTSNKLHTSRLCEPLKHPSPFALQGRRLVTVTLVRDPRTQPSYGVNLILHKEPGLVDPEWLEAQEKRELSLEAESRTSVIPSSDANVNSQDEKCAAKAISTIDNDKSVVMNSENGGPSTIKAGETTKEASSEAIERVTETVNATDEAVSSASEKVDATTPESADGCKEENTVEMEKRDRKNAVRETPDQTQTAEALTPVASAQPVNVPSNMKNAAAPIQRRRRRVNFSVMLVREADKQNTRQPHISPDGKLQAGDIVIAIGDQDLSGLIFADACKVFSTKAVNVSESLICTKVVVARQKNYPVSASASSSHYVASSMSTSPSGSLSLPTNQSMEFSPQETVLLANGFRVGSHARSRMLGASIPDAIFEDIASVFRSASSLKNSAVTNRSAETLKVKWREMTRMKQFAVAEKARQFRATELRERFGEVQLPFSSLVEAHALRQAARGGPRPAKGCRCGQEDHEYLFEPACRLYADLRIRLSSEEMEELLPSKDVKGKLSSKEKKALNAVSTANKTRMLKLKELNEKEQAEDRFVAKMEEIQVQELKQAIFAPHLSSIVLSAICELQRDFPIPKEEDNFDDEEDDQEDDEVDEDDDVPLVSLGKREAAPAEENIQKQRKVSHDADPKISLEYLMRLFGYVSKTWGHCYREPSQLDYSWRWELFHGTYSSQQQWDAKSVCPRVANSLPFENIHFGLATSKAVQKEMMTFPDRLRQFEESLVSGGLQGISDPFSVPKPKAESASTPEAKESVVDNLSGSRPSPSITNNTIKATPGDLSATSDSIDQFCLAAHYLSPGGTGLYDEILALIQMEVIKVRSGIPVLTQDWHEKVDILVLDDFGLYWSSDLDPEGKYCINVELRDTLEEKWIKYDYGWALAEYPKELIFEYGQMDEWKEAFEDRLEENENRSEGIGRFGL